MKIWKSFIPSAQVLESLSKVSAGMLYIDQKNQPVLGTLLMRQEANEWVSLSWDYVDVEFKFEIYCLSIDSPKVVVAEDLVSIEELPRHSSIRLLTKTEWVRPAHGGEVPESFEQVLEESGLMSSIPDSATAIGTVLYGVIFDDSNGQPLLAVTVDDATSYSLRLITEPTDMALLASTCDVYSLPELVVWRPPEI
jgi:hypothetical protein